MANPNGRSPRPNDSAADLAKARVDLLLANLPQASTPELQAKQERLIRKLAESSSVESHEGSTASPPGETLRPLPRESVDVGSEETEEDGIRAEAQRRERVRLMAKQAQRTPDTR